MYRINFENTGLETYEKIERMAEIMRNAGYDVEATKNSGLINDFVDCPCDDQEWMNFLIKADEEA